MLKSLGKWNFLPLLILMTLSQGTSAEEPNLSPKFPCLTIDQERAIAICHDENLNCHQQLAKVSKPEPTWETMLLMLVAGVAGGAVLQNNFKH